MFPPGFNPNELPGQIVDDGFYGRIVDPESGAGLFNPNTDPNVVGVDPLTGEDSPIGTDVGFGAAVRRWVQAGVYNGDFSVPPNATGSQVEDAYNLLPYWSFQPTQSGQIVVFAEPQSGAAFESTAFYGYAFPTVDLGSSPNLTQLRFQMIGGGYVGDDAYLTQLVPVTTTADQAYELEAGFSLVRVLDTDPDAKAYLTVSFLQKNLLSSLASPNSVSIEASLAADSKATVRTSTIAIPDDAMYARLSVGMRRGAAAVSESAEFAISEVFLTQRERMVGSWTPTISFASTGDLAVSYSIQTGSYIRQGRQVTAYWDCRTSSFAHSTSSGNLLISGLPFSPATEVVGGSVAMSGWTSAGGTVIPYIAATSTLNFYIMTSGSALDSLSAATVPSGGTIASLGMVTFTI